MSELSTERRVLAVESLARETLAAYRLPGLAIVALRGTTPFFSLFVGQDAAGQPLTPRSLFPVASITKLATALAVLRLVEAGVLALDTPLATVLPSAAAARPGVTLRTLLCHRSGLPLDAPAAVSLDRSGLDWPWLARACLQTEPLRSPSTRVQYSNVGYGLLALAVEQQTGQPFPIALGSLVLGPLAIEGYLGAEPPRAPVVIADVRGPGAGGMFEPFNSGFWRSLALPWAGLLTTAGGVLALLRAFQGEPVGFLGRATLAEATRNQTDDLGGGYSAPLIWPRCPWGLGPELRDEKTPHWAPARAGPESFGHAGASGCLGWVAPAADVTWVILGSRTAENGWLVRRGPLLGAALLDAAATTTTG